MSSTWHLVTSAELPYDGGMKASAVLLFLGAVLLAAGVFTNSWMKAGSGNSSARAGLREIEVCSSGDECQSFSYTKMLKNSPRARDVLAAVSGMAALILGIFAVILACITAGLIVAKTPKSVLGVLTIISAALAGIASFAFIGSMEKGPELEYGFSLFVFEAGFIAALIGGLMSLSHSRTPTGTTANRGGFAPHAQIPGPPCSRCSQPAAFVPQYQRYFCSTCNVYL